MNRKSRVSFGPGAASLILIVVILSLSVLGMLALMNARSDSRLSKRSVQVVEAVYALDAQAERSLASLDANARRWAAASENDAQYIAYLGSALPEGMTLMDREISWEESDGFRTLECAVEVLPLGEAQRLRWTQHRLMAVTEDIWN